MAEKAAKKVTPKKSTTKKTTSKAKVTSKAKKANQKIVKETRNLNEEAMFSVWIDILILIFVLIMFGVILYGYLV